VCKGAERAIARWGGEALVLVGSDRRLRGRDTDNGGRLRVGSRRNGVIISDHGAEVATLRTQSNHARSRDPV